MENRLVSNTGPLGTMTLRYDPLGRLERIDSPGGSRSLQYDGDALVLEYVASTPTVVTRYVHGPGAGDDPLVSYSGASAAIGNARFLYRDARGSIVLRADTNGTSTAINTYDEYGIPAAANVGAFQYTGQVWLPELGLYTYKARMYSPTLGRFMQTDPIGYEDAFNLYGYVGNDPVNRSDPSGMEADGGQLTIGPVTLTYDDESGLAATVVVENSVYEADFSVNAEGATLSGRSDSIDVKIDASIDFNDGTAIVSGNTGPARGDVVSGPEGTSVSTRVGEARAELNYRTEQPERVPVEVKGRDGAESVRRGDTTPKTYTQKAVEVIRTVLDVFGVKDK